MSSAVWTCSQQPATARPSQARSWSQSSQGRRHEPLRSQTTGVQSLQKLQEWPDTSTRSPRPQTSRRAPSYTHLQSVNGSRAGSAGPQTARPKAFESHDDTPASNVRHSLLQHIQSVQREITRLQLERQRAHQPQVSHLGTGGRTPTRQSQSLVCPSSPIITDATERLVSKMASAAPTSGTSHLCSPVTVTRSVSERPPERWRQQPSRRESHGTMQSTPTSQVASVVQSPTLVPAKPYSEVSFKGSRPASVIHSRPEGLSARSDPALAPATADPVASVDESIYVKSAIKIQRAWRKAPRGNRQVNGTEEVEVLPDRKIAERPVARVSRGGALLVPAYSPTQVTRDIRRTPRRCKAVHHAACRIQRAWRVHRWRWHFTDFSERHVGWVGSLDWLQRHNMLYGTELADEEDVSWWIEHRTLAPLDREVDPWGFERLREHLNRMWYGRAVEVQEREEDMLAMSENHSYQYEIEQSEDIFAAFAAVPVEPVQPQIKVASQQWAAKPTFSRGRAQAGAEPQGRLLGIGSLRSLPADQNRRQVSMTSSVHVASKAGPRDQAASLSPRRDPVGVSSEGRKGPLGSGPLMHYQKGPNYRVASHSPLQTHRAPRATVPVAPSVVSLRPRSPVPETGSGRTDVPVRPRSPVPGEPVPLRPRSPVQGTRVQATPSTRLSLPSTASMRSDSWVSRGHDGMRRGSRYATSTAVQAH